MDIFDWETWIETDEASERSSRPLQSPVDPLESHRLSSLGRWFRALRRRLQRPATHGPLSEGMRGRVG